MQRDEGWWNGMRTEIVWSSRRRFTCWRSYRPDLSIFGLESFAAGSEDGVGDVVSAVVVEEAGCCRRWRRSAGIVEYSLKVVGRWVGLCRGGEGTSYGRLVWRVELFWLFCFVKCWKITKYRNPEQLQKQWYQTQTNPPTIHDLKQRATTQAFPQALSKTRQKRH